MSTPAPAAPSMVPAASRIQRTVAALVLGTGAACALAQTPLQAAGDREIGLALRWQPVVEGTSKTGFDVVPLLDLSRDRWFVRNTRGATEAGALLLRGESARVGVVLAYEAGRRASDVDSLSSRGVPDRSDGVSYGPFLEWVGSIGPAPVSTVLRLRLHGDADRGSQVDLRVTMGLAQTQRLRLGGFAQLTWADALSMDASFGVDQGLAAGPGLRPYRAGAGLRQASAGLLGTWRLTPTWGLAGLVEARALGSSPVGSPLVTRRVGGAAVFGVTYAF
jgi:outer membrane scaffolding protein for murein synthesis (MipA/OmpV family)